jgi:hypothetical protein
MDNPSAYLTFLVAKCAKEGIHDKEAAGKTKSNKKEGAFRKGKFDEGDSSNSKSKRLKEWRDTSSLRQSGLDIPLSDKRELA